MVIVTIRITLLDYTVHVSVWNSKGPKKVAPPSPCRHQGTVETNHEIHQ